MNDNIGRGIMGLFGCLCVVIVILALVIVGFLIHWPTWYCVTAIVVTCIASNVVRAWVDS